MARLHRQLVGNWDMSDPVFRSIVGRDPWTIVEEWSDHNNANQALADQVLGELARKDKWQQQIYDLQAQVKSLGARPTKAQLDAANKKANDLAKAMDSAQAQAAEERKRAQEADAKTKAIEAEQAKAKQEADNFLTALINAVRGIFGGKS